MDYLLDFILESFTLDPNFEIPDDPVYIIFQTDGSSNSVVTSTKTPERIIDWNFKVRIILQIDNLSTACLYSTLCTYSQKDQKPIPLGNAKIRLRSFPVGNPAKFSFHIFNPNNSALKVGTINLTATMATMIRNNYPMAIPITH